MEVASVELCRELEKVSGWVDTYQSWQGPAGNEMPLPRTHMTDNHVSAYSLGYLLRKLPSWCRVYHDATDGTWFAVKFDNVNTQYQSTRTADTPENAAVKLCLELFKQGILTKNGDNPRSDE